MENELLERVIVSPVAGVFTPTIEAEGTTWVVAGATVGVVRCGADDVTVVSPFAGQLVDVVAASGERLEPYQRVAWLRVA